MAKKFKEGALTESEKKIVKKMLAVGWRGQDILAVLNIGRSHSTNSGRITGVNKDGAQVMCTDAELERFLEQQRSFDLKTGLNSLLHERLVRAREAMVLAVQLFNSPLINFKTEVFSVLSNIAWTYLCHERLLRLGLPITGNDGKHLQLSSMIEKDALGLSAPIKANLFDIKEVRDKVEHSLLQRSDRIWRGLFQANCLNFDRTMCAWFGEKTSLRSELSFTLQFVKADIEQVAQLSSFDIPEEIQTLCQELKAKHSEDVLGSTDYEFSVVYTMVASTKAKAHIHFVSPETDEGKDISNVLIKYKPSDDLYPFKPTDVVKAVVAATGKHFTVHDHTMKWKDQKIRPESGKPDPKKTNSKYCTYNKAHKDYTYSKDWVDLIVASLS